MENIADMRVHGHEQNGALLKPSSHLDILIYRKQVNMCHDPCWSDRDRNSRRSLLQPKYTAVELDRLRSIIR